MFAIAVWAVIGSAPAADDRAPMPAEKDIERAVEDMRLRFKADFASTTPSALTALAARLHQLGLDTNGNAAARFALFRESADVAARAGDLSMAMKAVKSLTGEFQFDPLAMQIEVLDKLAAATDPQALRAAALFSLRAIDAAQRADNRPAARRLAGLAAKAVAKVNDEALEKAALLRGAEVAAGEREFGIAKESRERFEADPKNAAAARAVGRCRCLFNGAWDRGLPLVAEFGEDAFKDAAVKDVAAPEKPEDRVALADAWWSLAEQEKGAAATALRRRAAHWYRLALPKLTGLARDRPVRRIESSDPADPWCAMDLERGKRIDEYFRIEKGAELPTLAEITGPFDMRVVARTAGNNVRFYGPSGSLVIFNWEVNNRELRVHRPDSKNDKPGTGVSAPFKPLVPDTWYQVRWRMSATQVDVWVDDKLVFTERGKYNLSAKSPLRVASYDHAVDVRQIVIKPLK